MSEQGRRVRRSERNYYDQGQNMTPPAQQAYDPAQYGAYPQGYQPAQAYQQSQPYQQVQAYQQSQPYQPTQAYQQFQPYQQVQAYQQSQPYQPTQAYQQSQPYQQVQAYQQPQNGYAAQYPVSAQSGAVAPVRSDYAVSNAPREAYQQHSREDLLKGLNAVLRDIEKILAARKRQIDLVAQLRQQTDLVSKATLINFFTKGKGGILFLIEIMIALFSISPVIRAYGGFAGFVMWAVYAGIGLGAHLTSAKAKTPTQAKIYAGLCALLNFYLLSFAVKNINVILTVVSIVFVVLTILIVRAVNRSRAQENERIARHNEEVNQMYQQTVREIVALQASMKKNYGGWYPKDYFCLDAVKFCISAVENFRADSIKEAINLYESSEHQRRMEAAQSQLIMGQKQMLDSQDKIIAGQKIMVEHLDYANVLSMENLKMQRETQAAIRQASNEIQGAVHSSAAQTRAEISNSARSINQSIKNAETNVTVHIDDQY